MSEVQVELCPETGICSILKDGAGKVDLMPDEVAALRDAHGDAEVIKSRIGEVDSSFSVQLSVTDVASIAGKLKA